MQFQTGLGNHISSEAINGALPQGQNSPQQPPLGLYAEQISGSAFTRRPRSQNQRSWVYRILPSVVHQPPEAYQMPHFDENQLKTIVTPAQLRFKAPALPTTATDFLQGLMPLAKAGMEDTGRGGLTYLYVANKSMEDTVVYSADGEWLIVPQLGKLKIHTEMGGLEIAPWHIGVIPRGIKFSVELLESQARGYVLENFGAPFQLPELGPIGSNGLANTRDFLIPEAQYFENKTPCKVISKFLGKWFVSETPSHPLNVVAWHGNYYPYQYDLRLFNTMNTVSFDHPDPSIFTVLTSQSDTPGVANLDFVIFPPRWMVSEHTFRPPYYHRNIMNELMGLIEGIYDAKGDEFSPGGSSIHNCFSAHGPDLGAFNNGTHTKAVPTKIENTMAFMFESPAIWQATEWSMNSNLHDKKYYECWQNLSTLFKGK